jgi:lipopolysaccharide export system permease protein
MYRYNKYITKHLIHSTLLITFSLTSIVWLTQALRFIDFMVNQGISIGIFLTLTGLLIPSLLLMILPPALFCAILFVYNRLTMDSELVVLQSAGLSRWRLALPALQVAAAIMIISYLLALYLQPLSHRQFRDMQSFLRNNYVSILLQEGVFSTPVNGLMVFIRDRDKHNTLHGILVHDNRQPESSITMMAEQGQLVETPQGPRFLLQKGNRQEMRDGKLSFLNFDHYALDISLYDKSVNTRPVDPQELFLSQLFTYDETASAGDNLKRRAEGHQRLLWPVYPVALALMALAVLLSGQFNRRGHWQRLMVAILLGTVMLFSAVGLRGMMALNPAFIALAYLNLLIPSLAASFVLQGYTGHFTSIKKAEPGV